MSVELLPHQEEVIDKIHNGSVLTGGVGTGKTVTALVYFYTKVLGGVLNDYSSISKPVDLYVFTTARKRDSLDWQEWAVRMGISTDRDASATGVQLVVDSYNNIDKYKEVKDAFIILDEQRLVGSGAWTKAFLVLAKSNRWIMLSATPGDVWEDYIPLFVANGFYKNRTAFKREHCVYSYYGRYPKLERYLGEAKLEKLKQNILVEMPYERHTTRHTHVIPVTYDKELFKKVVKDRWHVYENRPLKDVSELFSVMRKVVNSDVSRLNAVRDLMKNHPRLIVFYNFDYELEMLRSLGGALENSIKDSTLSGFTGAKQKIESSSVEQNKPYVHFAEWNGHKHEPIPKTDRWVYLVQYVAGAEAWNCVETNSVVFYSLTYSYKNFEQAQGRIDRLDTPFSDLHYYILMSDSVIDKGVSKALKNKKNFNEKNFLVYT